MSLIHSTHGERRKILERKRRQNNIMLILAVVLGYAIIISSIVPDPMCEQRSLLSGFISNLTNALSIVFSLCKGEDVPFHIEYARDIALALAVGALVLMLLKFAAEGVLKLLKSFVRKFKSNTPIISTEFAGIFLFFLSLATVICVAFVNDKESAPYKIYLRDFLVFTTVISYIALFVIAAFKGIADLFRKIKARFETVKNKKQQAPKVPLKQMLQNLSQKQKVFLGLAVVAEVLILLLILNGGPDFSYRRYGSAPDGFFTFLRISACAAFVGLLLEKLSFWLKFPLLLLAILYNPVIPIRLDREDWLFFNIITVPMLAVPWIILLRRLRRKDAAPDPKEVS